MTAKSSQAPSLYQQALKTAEFASNRDSLPGMNKSDEVLTDDLFNDYTAPVPYDNTSMLVFKVVELQKICKSLSDANGRLMDRIQALEGGKTQKKIGTFGNIAQNDEIRDLHETCEQVELMISQYRKNLSDYQEDNKKQFQAKALKIAQTEKVLYNAQNVNKELREEIAQLRIQLDQVKRQRDLYSHQSSNLTVKNKNLLSDLISLSNQSQRKVNTTNGRNGQQSTEYIFDGNTTDENIDDLVIQNELESIISKMMVQLDSERLKRRKISEELIRVQKELLDKEKEIMGKNSRIYELELAFLRQQKRDFDYETPLKGRNQSKGAIQTTQSRNSVKLSPLPKSFKLSSVLQSPMFDQLTSTDQLLLCSKLLELFIRRIQRSEMAPMQAQELQVFNYNSLQPWLITMRRDPNLQAHSLTNSLNPAMAIKSCKLLIIRLLNMQSKQTNRWGLQIQTALFRGVDSNGANVSVLEEIKIIIDGIIPSA